VSDADLAEAKKRVELLTWAASKLASEGSPQASTVQAKADQAVASYNALKAAKQGGGAAPAAAAPVAAAPVAAAPVAAAPVAAGGASAEEIAEAKKQVDLLTWAAKTLANSGSPQAAAIQAKADMAVATYNAMKQGGGARAAAAPAAAAAPVAAAPVAAAPALTPAVNPADITEAKKQMELLTWAADALAKKSSPQAAGMAAKAQQATAAYEALKQKQSAR
jgi:hypothetical protein